MAQKSVLGIATTPWFKVSDTQGCPLVVCWWFGGGETRTLNRIFPMVQNLLQSGMSPSGIWVLSWRTNP